MVKNNSGVNEKTLMWGSSGSKYCLNFPGTRKEASKQKRSHDSCGNLNGDQRGSSDDWYSCYKAQSNGDLRAISYASQGDSEKHRAELNMPPLIVKNSQTLALKLNPNAKLM
jgi:hypothetical protein